jgi:hypothetical protein
LVLVAVVMVVVVVLVVARLEVTVQRAASESWAGRRWSAGSRVAAATETAAIGRCRLSRP